MSIPDSIYHDVRRFQASRAPVKRERLRSTLKRRTKIARRLGVEQNELPARFFDVRERREYIALRDEYDWRAHGLLYPGDQISVPGRERWRVDVYAGHDGVGWVIVRTRYNLDGTISTCARAFGAGSAARSHDWVVFTPDDLHEELV